MHQKGSLQKITSIQWSCSIPITWWLAFFLLACGSCPSEVIVIVNKSELKEICSDSKMYLVRENHDSLELLLDPGSVIDTAKECIFGNRDTDPYNGNTVVLRVGFGGSGKMQTIDSISISKNIISAVTIFRRCANANNQNTCNEVFPDSKKAELIYQNKTDSIQYTKENITSCVDT